MASLLLKVIPLDLAATLSPGILALAVILLGGKHFAKTRAFALFLGIFWVGVVIAVLGLSLGSAAPEGVKQTTASAIIDLIFGAVFIVFAIRQLLSKERKIKPSESEERSRFFRWLIFGVLVSATNFDALFLSLAAAKEVGAAGVSSASQFVILAINVIFFSLPALLPLLIYLISPESAGAFMAKINQYVLKYAKYVLFAMFATFGILLISRAAVFFY